MSGEKNRIKITRISRSGQLSHFLFVKRFCKRVEYALATSSAAFSFICSPLWRISIYTYSDFNSIFTFLSATSRPSISALLWNVVGFPSSFPAVFAFAVGCSCCVCVCWRCAMRQTVAKRRIESTGGKDRHREKGRGCLAAEQKAAHKQTVLQEFQPDKRRATDHFMWLFTKRLYQQRWCTIPCIHLYKFWFFTLCMLFSRLSRTKFKVSPK